jgi:hypothetical protein
MLGSQALITLGHKLLAKLDGNAAQTGHVADHCAVRPSSNSLWLHEISKQTSENGTRLSLIIRCSHLLARTRHVRAVAAMAGVPAARQARLITDLKDVSAAAVAESDDFQQSADGRIPGA